MFKEKTYLINKPNFSPAWLILICLFLFGATQVSFTVVKPPDNAVAGLVKKAFMQNLSVYKAQTDKLIQALELINQKQATVQEARTAFYKTKQAYKKTEYLLEYLDPEIGKTLNGAPLPRVVIEHQDYLTLGFKEPTHVTFAPEGLQVLEEILFSEEVNAEAIKNAVGLAYRLQEKNAQFQSNLQNQALTDKQIWSSLREQLIRVITLGLTGFDAPAAGNEIQNAAIALQPVLETAKLYEQNLTTPTSRTPLQKSIKLLAQALIHLQQHPDFATFDRLYFIREIANPVYAALTEVDNALLPGRATSGTALTKPVNDQAQSIFSVDYLIAGYYAKEDRTNKARPLANLGKTLFFDPILSANNQRACASCHAPAKAFTDGRPKSIAFDDQSNVYRNSPTLLNAIYSKAYFWDSRADFLQDQVPGVLTKADELHGSYDVVVQKLKSSEAYRGLFRQAFKDLPASNTINTNTINRALAAYIQTLVALNSPFDKYMRRETDMLPDAAKRGFNLFMGKAACGTCHFAPVFNGTVPPRYLESETEVLGVPATADFTHPTSDIDPGRAGIIKATALHQSFKTPTVRNAALTGPYMHNGAFTNLAEVLEFYNRGGGAGLGLPVPNQTLPADALELTAAEKQDIISFIETLTDTAGTNAIPKKLPAFPGKTNLNSRPIGGRY